jgi:ParB family transcriptional regulator, chromosome partitioning protein
MAKSSSPAPRLGRGLSSLISVSDVPVERTIAPTAASPSAAPPTNSVADQTPPKAVLDIPVGSIAPNPHQPRRSIDEATLNDLANSIRASGVIQPIVVRRLSDGSYQLIAGERRWRASQKAGLTTIPAIVREVDGFTQAQMALVENIQREDLNPIDRATGYRTLINQLGLTQQELATRLGEERGTIGHFLRLLDLHPTVQESVRTGQLSLGHAKLLAGVQDHAEQQRLAQMTVSQGLSMRNLERLIEGSATNKKVDRTKIEHGNSMHLLDLEKSIARQIGMRVQVHSSPKSKGKGRLVIHYANLDQFDDLMGRLNVKLDE